MPNIFIVAAAMHPRIKIRGVVLLLQKIAANLGIAFPIASESDVSALLSTIYASYESRFDASTTNRSDSLPSSTVNNDPSWSLLSSGGPSVSCSSELFMYLDMNFVPTDENI